MSEEIKVFSVRLSKTLYSQLSEARYLCRMSMQQVVTEAIRAFLSDLSLQDQEI